MTAELLHLDTNAINCVLAFPQADLDLPVYTELSTGMDLQGKGKASSHYVLRLNKFLYDLKQISINWLKKLKEASLIRGFVESVSDLCVYISSDMIILV